jgi:hypothetical protein
VPRLNASHRAVLMSMAAILMVRATVLTQTARGDMPPMPIIAQNGFGESANSYAWSMAWFKGALYVGTARNALCVERATIEFYLPWGSYYTSHPVPDVSCPPTIADADLRAEIWRYSPRTRRWTRVYRSPTVPNPEAGGRPVARDIGYRGMVVLNEPGRPSTLAVAGLTADEFIPELARRDPPRILLTSDGTHFRPVAGGPGVVHDTLGPRRPVGYRAMAVLDGKLYVTASGGLTGDGVVLRVSDPSGSSPHFTQVSPSRLAVFELTTFDGHLYAGTGDSQHGYGVWRADGRRSLRWTPVVTGGAGRGALVTSVVSMQSYRGRLYVGASGWGTSIFPVSELIRIGPDGRWDVVVGAARSVNGTVRAPVSQLTDGFGNPYNLHFWRMDSYDGALLLGTNDWSWSLNGLPGVDDALRSQFGFDLYGTCDGNTWWAATRNGFGRPFDFGVRTMVSSPAGLFLGTTNLVQGTTIRESRAQPCSAGHSRVRIARVPRGARSSRYARLREHPPFGSDLATGLSSLAASDEGRLPGRLRR